MSEVTSNDVSVTQPSHIDHAGAADFAQLVVERSHMQPVLVDFWAPWCGPCTMLLPILENVVRSYAGKVSLVKVNTDEEQALAVQFGVRSLPTVKLFRNGDVVDEFMGVQREETIRHMLERHVDKPADRILRLAEEHLAAHNAEAARKLLEALIEEEPDNEEAKLGLAAAMLGEDDTGDAQLIFSQLSPAAQTSDKGQQLAAQLQFATALIDAPDTTALEDRVRARPDDLQARYLLGARYLLAGQHESALQHLLEIMKRDRAFGDDLARKSLIAAFKLIDNPKIVTRYRQRMAALMF